MTPAIFSSEASIYDWLSDAESHFLSAVQHGDLNSFSELWLGVLGHVKGQKLSTRTLKAADAAAHVVETLSLGFIDLHTRMDELESSSSSEILQAIQGISPDSEAVQDQEKIPTDISISGSGSYELEGLDGLDTLTPQSHKWLLQNIHNPYPSSATKKQMSLDSGVPLKSVNMWFTNIRRRIGWNRIMKQYFRGDRSAMLEFARRVLLDGQSGSDVDGSQGNQIARELLEMKTFVEKVHLKKYEESDFVKNLDFASATQHRPSVVQNNRIPSEERHFTTSSMLSESRGAEKKHHTPKTRKRSADTEDFVDSSSPVRDAKRRRKLSSDPLCAESDFYSLAASHAPPVHSEILRPSEVQFDWIKSGTLPLQTSVGTPDTHSESQKRPLFFEDDLLLGCMRRAQPRRGLRSTSDSVISIPTPDVYLEEVEDHPNNTHTVDDVLAFCEDRNGDAFSEDIYGDLADLLTPWHNTSDLLFSWDLDQQFSDSDSPCDPSTPSTVVDDTWLDLTDIWSSGDAVSFVTSDPCKDHLMDFPFLTTDFLPSIHETSVESF